MKKQNVPLFEVGDTVFTPPNLYKETEGEITKVDRLFKEIDANGKFTRNGLVTEESTIKNCVLPYAFDGETLSVDFPETDYGGWIQKAFTKVSKFYGYAYTVKTPEINTLWQEKRLRLKAKRA